MGERGRKEGRKREIERRKREDRGKEQGGYKGRKMDKRVEKER